MNDTKPLFIYIVMLFVAPRIAFQIWLKGFGAMKHNSFIYAEKLYIHTYIGMYCAVLTAQYPNLQLIFDSY